MKEVLIKLNNQKAYYIKRSAGNEIEKIEVIIDGVSKFKLLDKETKNELINLMEEVKETEEEVVEENDKTTI